MAKLILSLNGAVLGEYPIDKESISIGRKPHNDIQIDNLAVSGDHATITSIYNYHFVEDLGSTNGTLVNDEEIKKQVLNNNDLIKIGKHELRYINEDVADPADLDKTVVIRRPDAVPAAGGDTAKQPVTNLISAHLKVLSGPNKDKILELSNASTTIGRQGSQLAIVTRQADGYYISPGKGKSLPMVDGHPVEDKRLLRDHDIIEFENIRMEFTFK
jgi:hypothetical protein